MYACVQVLVILFFALISTSVSAQVFLELDQPRPGDVVGDQVNVAITTMGAIARIEASVGTHTATLSSAGGRLSLVGEPSGAKSLIVTAYDASNNPTQKSVSIVLDRPPQVVISSPAVGQVIHPGTLTVTGSCTDDGPLPCMITTSPVLEVTADAEGKPISVEVTAKDSAGQSTSESVQVYVESSPTLREVLSADAGAVLDFDGTRALVRAANGTRAAIWTAGGSSTVVLDGANPIISGQLFAQGALVVTSVAGSAGIVTHEAWLWTNGTATKIGVDGRIAGNWLALLVPSTAPPDPQFPDAPPLTYLVLRDLSTGRDTVITNNPPTATDQVSDFLVAKNGDLLWQLELVYRINLRRAGVVSQLMGSSRPLAAFALDEFHASGEYFGTGNQELYLYSDTGRETICNGLIPGPGCRAALLVNGWVGYTVPAAQPSTAVRVFRRKPPAGDIEEVLGFDPQSTLTAMSPSGEIAADTPTRRQLGGGDAGAPRDVSSKLGRPLYLDRWFVLLGRSVFEVITPDEAGDPDAGAGFMDSGVSSDRAAGDAGLADHGDAGVSGHPLLDSGVDANLPSGTDGGSAAPTGPKKSDDGNGCSLAGGRRADLGLPLLLLALGLVVRRRRYRC